MSPRQMAAYLFIANRRARQKSAEHIWISALGSRGDPREVKKQLKELQK